MILMMSLFLGKVLKKQIQKKPYLFLCLLLTPQWVWSQSSLHSIEGGMDLFHEYLQFSNQPEVVDSSQMITVLTRHYMGYKPSKFNALLALILNTYYEKPESRRAIYPLVVSMDFEVHEELKANKENSLLLSTAEGAINGAFILTLARMGTRLSRKNLTKKTLNTLNNMFIDYRKPSKLNQKMTQGLGKFKWPTKHKMMDTLKKSKDWLQRQIPSIGGQYVAAGLAGGTVGAMIYGLKKLQGQKIPPSNLLKFINHIVLAETVIGGCEIHQESQNALHSNSMWMLLSDEVDESIRNLETLMEVDLDSNHPELLNLETQHASFFPQIQALGNGNCQIQGDQPVSGQALLHQLNILSTDIKKKLPVD